MFSAFDITKIIKQFIPPHKQVEIQDRIVDTLAKAFPDERWRNLIQAYRSDAVFQDYFAIALKHAVKRFAIEYEDMDLVDAVTQDTHFWDIPSVQRALQEIIAKPSSYLRQERKTVLQSFVDVLPTLERERVELAVHFFLRALTQEVITIPQLAPIYQVQFQWASLEQSHQLVGLQRDQNLLMATLLEAVQSQRFLAAPSSPIPSPLLPRAYDNLPPQYGEFLGRDKDIKQVLDALRSRWPLVSIEGLGGMGKTTLAIQTAHLCLAGPQALLDPPFEYVVWVSAKDRPEQKLWLNEILDVIAHRLGYPFITKLPLEQSEQKKGEVYQLLHHHRTLLIIDNFETIRDAALVSWMQDVPGQSKVLITSRTGQLRRIGTRPIDLKGLEEPQALELIRNHAQSLSLQSIASANDDALLPLVRVTGGNPKVMGMALGYIKRGRLNFKEVIEHLYAASKTVEDIYDGLFPLIWNVMTREAQHVLLVIPFFAEFASKEALGAAAGLTEYYLDNAMEELVELKLLDIKEDAMALSQYYSVHPLTRNFATAQLQHDLEFEEQARARWSKYYLDFASRSLVREKPKEHYWNSLLSSGFTLIDPEWSNFRQLLEWADQQRKDQLLLDLMLLIVHYMERRFLFTNRLYYAQRVAEIANRLGRKEDEALFRIDALGWTLIDEEKYTEAEQEITTGIHIAESLGNESSDATDLAALGNIFLARMFLERGNVETASELMDNIDLIKCKPVIQNRAYIIGGDIAQRKKQNLEALRFYRNAALIGEEYGGEGEGFDSFYRSGLVHLANGDIEQAETYFNRALIGVKQYGVTGEVLYSKYGLARVARLKGERDKARQLAKEVLDYLSRVVPVPSHWLMKQIHDFLQSLDAK